MTQAFDLDELKRLQKAATPTFQITGNPSREKDWAYLRAACSAVPALIEEIERLREALTPFADKAALYMHPSYDVLVGVPQKMSFTIGTMRQARAALGYN